MTMRTLFANDVTRDIPPVVYFHEQAPEKLAAEVREYIITGGWPDGHPNKKRVPEGIHESYVRLLRGIAAELDKAGGPDLPTAWISGFYGSGKSSFAKLIGLALDRHPTLQLPDGAPLFEALLARDTSPRAAELRAAFDALIAKLGSLAPLSVVFDIGGTARDHEHVHAVAVRQLQRRLGYSQSDPHVADFELRLEKTGDWQRFEALALEVLGQPWAELKDNPLAEEDFSLVLHKLYPQHYPEPTAWFASRGGSRTRDGSPQDAVLAIRDMLRFRAPDATVFLVVDEVSQYVIGNKDRVDRLRAFATELGAVLHGRVWLIALGQQKLDEQADQSVLVWLRDRFPPRLQIHLAPTNIRDVIHRRLLQKTPAGEAELRRLFDLHRSSLKLFAYGASDITPDDFVEVYPLLPNHIELLLQITSALRLRTSRAQGDDHGIRGALQLLGELFRSQRLADAPIGSLISFDQIYEVQHTALDSDLQASMARVLSATVNADPLLLRAAKIVALLEHIQEVVPTSAELVSQCLFDRVDCGDRTTAVKAALEALRLKNLLGYSEKTGYKIQSSSAEEWEDEKARIGVSRDQQADLVKDALGKILPAANRARLQGREFPWRVTFATRLADDGVLLVDPRDQGAMSVDLRWLARDEREDNAWVKRSAESSLKTRLVWVGGDDASVADVARELARSRDMVLRYRARRESLVVAKKNLLNNEEARQEELSEQLKTAVGLQFVAGRMYFDRRIIDPKEHGQSFAVVMTAAAARLLPEIYSHFEPLQVAPSQLQQLVAETISGIANDFVVGPLSLFELEAGRYVATAAGAVPTRVLEVIKARSGMTGSALLTHFSAPPFAWPVNVVKAGVIGLVRAAKLKIQPEDGLEVTRIRDPGVLDIFDKDRPFRAASFFPANEPVDPRVRNRIARLFLDELGVEVERDEDKIVDAVAKTFPSAARRARAVLARYARLPGRSAGDKQVADLSAVIPVLEGLVGVSRYTEQTMTRLQKDLDPLRDGLRQLATLEAELTEEVVEALSEAFALRQRQGTQLETFLGEHIDREVAGALAFIDQQLAAPKPWLEVLPLGDAVMAVREAYRAERQRLLAWQETAADAARGRVKTRVAFVALAADQQHAVLRPIALAGIHTTVEALSPELLALGEPFAKSLELAEERAVDAIDAFEEAARQAEARRVASARTAGRETQAPAAQTRAMPKPVYKLKLSLSGREVASKDEVEQLLAEVRDMLMEHVRAGKRVRIS